MFPQQAIEDFKIHARQEYPKECCGVIVSGAYVPLENVSESPLTDFRISDEDTVRYCDVMEAVLHSHPNGPSHPSKSDVTGQMGTDVPWGIAVVTESSIGEVFFWGDTYPMAPILGRPFLFNIHDCYTLGRDYYRTEKGIELPRIPCELDWWANGENLYEEKFAELGFVDAGMADEPEIGAPILFQIRAPVANHLGIYIGNGLVLHHLMNRLSCRKPLVRWRRYIKRVLRYTG